MCIILIPSVRAEDSMKVTINTRFEEQIDTNKIEKIFVMMDDVNKKNYNINLERKDNFHYEVDSLPNGNIKINSINVSRDYTLNYNYQYAITRVQEDEINVLILVRKVSKDPNRKKVEVSYEYIADVLGHDPLKIPGDNPLINQNNASNLSSTTSNNQNSMKDERQNREKKQEQENRKRIYFLILLIMIVTIIFIGIIIGIKIANVNK